MAEVNIDAIAELLVAYAAEEFSETVDSALVLHLAQQILVERQLWQCLEAGIVNSVEVAEAVAAHFDTWMRRRLRRDWPSEISPNSEILVRRLESVMSKRD
jgi:hypothetical protein